jgi:hypothetical protein
VEEGGKNKQANTLWLLKLFWFPEVGNFLHDDFIWSLSTLSMGKTTPSLYSSTMTHTPLELKIKLKVTTPIAHYCILSTWHSFLVAVAEMFPLMCCKST